MTETEKILSRYSEKSFLKLWTYTSPYTNRYKTKKEICDVLVVFGNHIIIFSDKAIKYTESDIAWERWFNKAISASAEQIYGAETTLKEYQSNIFSDTKCTKKLPVDLPSKEDMIIHRVITVPQAKEGLKFKDLIGGSGTFIVNPTLKGEEEHLKLPFNVGQINPDKGYIHILNETSLEILMNELDTLTDFIDYLQSKEKLILSNKLFAAYGEEEILVTYLDNEHSLEFSEENILIQEGIWSKHKISERYFLKKKENEVSYFWDSIIEHFTKEMLNNNLVGQSEENPLEIEIALRFMASESRLQRRILSKSFIDRLKIYKDGLFVRRYQKTEEDDTKAYVFLVFNKPNDILYDEYIKLREYMLYEYMMAVKSKEKYLKNIIGLARESFDISNSTYSLLYLNCSDWSKEQQSEAEELCEVGRYFKPEILKKTYSEEQEYPENKRVK